MALAGAVTNTQWKDGKFHPTKPKLRLGNFKNGWGSNVVALDPAELKRRGPQYLQAFQADLTARVVAQEMARGRFPKKREDYVVVVDRKRGAPLIKVRPGGKISFLNNKATFLHILTWIGEQIVLLSPYSPKGNLGSSPAPWRSTHYRNAHLMMIDGKAQQRLDLKSLEVSFNSNFSLKKEVETGKVFQFVNVLPYARRIEFGSGSAKGMKKVGASEAASTRRRSSGAWSGQAPSGVYRKVARMAAARFGAAVRVEYRSVQVSNIAYTIPDKAAGSSISQFYPSIRVRPRNTAKLT